MALRTEPMGSSLDIAERGMKPVVNDGDCSPCESWRGDKSSVIGCSLSMSSHEA